MKLKNPVIWDVVIKNATEEEKLDWYIMYVVSQIKAYYHLWHKDDKHLKAIRHNCKLVSKIFEDKWML